MGGRIGERAYEVQELDDRAGPAVAEQQRQCAVVGRALVDGVDVLPFDLCGEMVEGVELGLGGPPVVAVGPVGGQVLQPGQVAAVVPAAAGDLVGPAGGGQAAAQVGDVVVGDGDRERSDFV